MDLKHLKGTGTVDPVAYEQARRRLQAATNAPAKPDDDVPELPDLPTHHEDVVAELRGPQTK